MTTGVQGSMTSFNRVIKFHEYKGPSRTTQRLQHAAVSTTSTVAIATTSSSCSYGNSTATTTCSSSSKSARSPTASPSSSSSSASLEGKAASHQSVCDVTSRDGHVFPAMTSSTTSTDATSSRSVDTSEHRMDTTGQAVTSLVEKKDSAESLVDTAMSWTSPDVKCGELELEGLRVSRLKDECRTRRLAVSGTKRQLISRLRQFISQPHGHPRGLVLDSDVTRSDSHSTNTSLSNRQVSCQHYLLPRHQQVPSPRPPG